MQDYVARPEEVVGAEGEGFKIAMFALDQGRYTVAAGATLGGSGLVAGNTFISGLHSPGSSPGVLTNIARMLNHGALGGTGKMVILPVDQGFEHGRPGASPRTL
ncbi:hypothetical protein HC766_04955, partial [Candidatus Gracilibacteria bacterium]|nr:hypothetical protein [Candidatus Gracilibacteria bacterium]